MTTPDKIGTFLSDIKDISIGFNKINFAKDVDLDDAQIGYRIDTNGNSLITGNDGDWQEEWIVIASDGLGDPIFVDTNSPKLTVLTASHGEGSWDPFVIADSLGTFREILIFLNDISQNRTNPVLIEKNPISGTEKQIFLREIERKNPEADISYWNNFLE
jgi:hypothetical protein